MRTRLYFITIIFFVLSLFTTGCAPLLRGTADSPFTMDKLSGEELRICKAGIYYKMSEEEFLDRYGTKMP